MTTRCLHRLLPIFGALIFLTGQLAFTAQAQVPPANDDFVNAEVLPTDTTWLGSNVDATSEPGEPAHAGVPTGSFSSTLLFDRAMSVGASLTPVRLMTNDFSTKSPPASVERTRT